MEEINLPWLNQMKNDVIRKTFTDSDYVDWVCGTYFDFEIAKVTFE
ncbi:hypothetical protein [Enterococcus casseliflavus]